MKYWIFALLVALLSGSQGCQLHAGKVTPTGTHLGLYFAVGDVTGPGGMKGAEISEGGALLGLNIGTALIEAARDYMTSDGSTTVVQLPEGTIIPTVPKREVLVPLGD